jgi:hypothetical protein
VQVVLLVRMEQEEGRAAEQAMLHVAQEHLQGAVQALL